MPRSLLHPVTGLVCALALATGCAAATGERPLASAHLERPPSPAVTGPAASSAAPGLASTLDPYPAPGSDEGRADLAVVLWLQRTRTRADVDRARAEVTLDLDTFAEALGPGFEAAAHPRTRALLADAGERTRAVVGEAKRHFRRPRPYDADGRVAPAVDRERSFSYPSGHATRGVVLGRLLAELAPDRRARLLEVGLRAGYDRVVGGVHYPSDVLAGQRLAETIVRDLLADPEFRRALDEVRAAEWGRAPAPRGERPARAGAAAAP